MPENSVEAVHYLHFCLLLSVLFILCDQCLHGSFLFSGVLSGNGVM